MHHAIRQICQGELATRRSQVALRVVVGLIVAVVARGHAEGADIEFAPVDEQWVVDVLLHDASFLARSSLLNYNLLKLIPLLGHLDAHAPVCALAWLCDPNIVLVGMVLIILLEGQIVGVVQTLFHVEGDWQRIEGVLPYGLVVVLHVHEEGLLVAQVVVVLNLVCHLHGIGVVDFGAARLFLSFLLGGGRLNNRHLRWRSRHPM